MRNAFYYSISGTPSKDKYYVYATLNGNPQLKYDSQGKSEWGTYGRWQQITDSSIGSGKTNTAAMINKLGSTSGNIWYKINSLNLESYNGCNDWYIGSTNEWKKLGSMGGIYDDGYSWTSTDIDSSTAYSYGSMMQTYSSAKDSSNMIIPFRSF